MAERRRQYYTDQKIQGYLLVALVVIEFLLVVLMLWYLHSEINAIIESHLFRIHSPQEGAWPELVEVLAKVMTVFVVINIAVLVGAHAIWSRYIRKTVRQFSLVLDRILARDFSLLAESGKQKHPMAELVELWFEKERARNLRIQTLLNELEDYRQSEQTASQREVAGKAVAEYRRLLLAR